jgi:hypothetical protein
MTNPLRVLLQFAEDARNDRGREHEIDPVELVLHAQTMLRPLCELGQQIEDVTRRGQVLADHCARELALDLASRHGAGTRRAVEGLFHVEATTDA